MEPDRPMMDDTSVVSLAKVLWAALFASLFMYLLIAFQLKDPGAGQSVPFAQEGDRMGVILKICATATFVLAYVLPRLLSKVVSRRRTEGSAPSLARKFPPYLVQLALFESVALFGLVLAVGTSSGGKLWPFLIVAAIGFLGSFPSKEKLEAL